MRIYVCRFCSFNLAKIEATIMKSTGIIYTIRQSSLPWLICSHQSPYKNYKRLIFLRLFMKVAKSFEMWWHYSFRSIIFSLLSNPLINEVEHKSAYCACLCGVFFHLRRWGGAHVTIIKLISSLNYAYMRLFVRMFFLNSVQYAYGHFRCRGNAENTCRFEAVNKSMQDLVHE